MKNGDFVETKQTAKKKKNEQSGLILMFFSNILLLLVRCTFSFQVNKPEL